MLVPKNCILILFIAFFMFSVQAEVRESMLVSNNLFSSNVLSGEKRKIEHTIDSWITFLLEGKNSKEHYPSSFRKKHDVNQFRQLLIEARSEKTNSVLIGIADIYFSSAERIYREIVRNSPVYPTGGFSVLHDLSLFLDYSGEGDRMVVMMREWYIGLVFLSLAGFSSSYGKGLYISIIERIQMVSDFFFKISNQIKFMSYGAHKRRFFKTSPDLSVSASELFNSVTNFNNSFNRLHDVYFKFILPAFRKLSWVKYDVLHSDHPEVLFRYGRILHKAYGSKDNGLPYISMSADRGYLPAIKYLGKHYLQQKSGTHYQAGEQLMMEYLEGSSHLIEKLRVIRTLFRSNIERGNNIGDSFQKGISSLQRSCLAAFKSNRLTNNGRNIKRGF